jgi:acyl-CoA synthetase (AMP-forming)/AMP-acid ligase II
VKDVAVIGMPDERAGELPVAFVVKQPNENVTEEEIVRYIAGNLDTKTVCDTSSLEMFYFRTCFCPEASLWRGSIY